MGHDPMLLSDSIKNNICLGDDIDLDHYLKMVCLDQEVGELKKGPDTLIGNGGMTLSGGQQQRLALARTLAHAKPIIVLVLISQDFTTQTIRLTVFLPAVFLLCMTFQKREDLSFSSGTFINSF